MNAVAAAGVEVLAVAGRRLRQLRRAPARLLSVTLGPLISMVVLGYLFQGAIVVPGGNYQQYLFAGAAVQVGLAGVGPTAIAVATDLRGGLVDRFRSMPVNRFSLPLGHTLGDFAPGIASLGIVTVVGLLLGWRPHAEALSVAAGFALAALFIYVMLWVGVLFGMVMRGLETISSVAQFVVVVLPFFSNAFLATASMPALIRPISEWNPISAVMTVCRQLWGNAPSADGGGATLAAIVVLALLLAVSTVVSLRRFTNADS